MSKQVNNSKRPLLPTRLQFLLLSPLGILFACQVITLQGVFPAAEWIFSHLSAAAMTWLLLFLLEGALFSLCGLSIPSYLITALLPTSVTLVSHYKSVINGDVLMVPDFSLLGEFQIVAGYAKTHFRLSGCSLLALGLLLLLLYRSIQIDRKTFCPIWSKRRPLFVFFSVLLTFSLSCPGYYSGLYRAHSSQQALDDSAGVPLGLLSAYLGSEISGSAEYGELHMQQIFVNMQRAQAKLKTEAPAQKPHIIYIMNESFFDVTQLSGLQFSADPLSNYHRLSEESLYGHFYIVTSGGGTGWVEMESFMSVPGAFFGERANTDMKEDEYEILPSYVRTLRDNGYRTIAFHSHDDRLYNRRTTLPSIGFDTVLFADDCRTDRTTYTAGYYDDRSSADTVISLFEENRDTPTFIYNMTMQNHQPYYAGKYDQDRVTVTSDLLTDSDTAQLQCWVNGVYDADQMLGQLIDYFSRVDEPVLLVFSGDHKPGMSFGEFESLYTKLGCVQSTNSANWSPEEYQQIVRTDYLLWSNYGTETGRKDTCCTRIGTEIFRSAGLECTPYMAWLMQDNFPFMFRFRDFWADFNGESIEPTAEAERFWSNWSDIIYDMQYGENYIGSKALSISAARD